MCAAVRGEDLEGDKIAGADPGKLRPGGLGLIYDFACLITFLLFAGLSQADNERVQSGEGSLEKSQGARLHPEDKGEKP